MRTKRSSFKLAALVAGGAVVVAVGLVAGTATASNIDPVLSPQGLSAGAGIEASPAPAPSYKTNAAGQTVGSAAAAISPDTQPDLISVVATNGKTGYVLRTELEAADGTTAQASFKSPQDALKWQETEGKKTHTIPVYTEDGLTKVGQFIIGPVSGKVSSQ